MQTTPSRPRPQSKQPRSARPGKSRPPQCPFCGDRFTLFCRLDRPDTLWCASCSRFFRASQLRQQSANLLSILEHAKAAHSHAVGDKAG